MARNVKNPSGYHSSGKTIQEKAGKFGIFAKEYGWTGAFETIENGDVELTARRGENETIQITWYLSGGGEVHYSLAGERTKLRNVSAAAKIAQEEPNHKQFKKVVRRRKSLGQAQISSDLVLAELDNSDIKEVLFGRKVSWLNSLSGEIQSADVAGKKQFRVVRKENNLDYVEFCDSYGFHAVRLSAIMAVS